MCKVRVNTLASSPQVCVIVHWLASVLCGSVRLGVTACVCFCVVVCCVGVLTASCFPVLLSFMFMFYVNFLIACCLAGGYAATNHLVAFPVLCAILTGLCV